MIHQIIPSKRVSSLSFSKPVQLVSNLSSMMVEARRRDDIVKKLAKECKYHVGDIVKPWDKKYYNEYGEDIEILSICDSYGKMGKNETWPKDDEPFIVHAKSTKKNGFTFFCTTGFLVPHETTT